MIHSIAPQLDKSSKKYNCPACNQKTFVLYLQSDKNLIADSVGRCDREDNCGYHYTPKQYYQDNRIDRKKIYSNNPSSKKAASQPQLNRFQVQCQNQRTNKDQTDYIPLNYIYERAETRNSNLVYFLLELFDWQTLQNTIDPYFMGCTADKQTVFPQIDEQGRCRTAKIQQYNKLTGKRIKGAINWLHSLLKKEKKVSQNFLLQMCLFGLHLIRSKNNVGKTVCICESEKSAIIAAGFLPQYIWMAAGALSWLNIEKLKPLKDWNVILFPDTSVNGKAFEKWMHIAKEAQGVGIKVTVSTLLEDTCTVQQKELGYDIGDYLIESTKQTIETTQSKSTIINQIIDRVPAFAQLISSFNLEIIGTSPIK